MVKIGLYMYVHSSISSYCSLCETFKHLLRILFFWSNICSSFPNFSRGMCVFCFKLKLSAFQARSAA